MRVFKILDVKTFMQHFLVKESFDDFFLVSAKVVSFASFEIEGKRQSAWYDEEDAMLSPYIFWKEVRNQVSSLIKGERVPLSIKAVLRASFTLKESLRTGLCLSESTEFQLAINLKYEKGELSLTSGSFISDYLLGKELDAFWDRELVEFLRDNGIVFEIE